MDGKPKRRWLTFSIRTLLVAVTILCVWLGWQVHLVRERKELRSLIEQRGGWIEQLLESDNPFDDGPAIAAPAPPEPPIVRQWLGDESVRRIVLLTDSVTAGEKARIADAFPEAIFRPND
jgi:hypothetical protein